MQPDSERPSGDEEPTNAPGSEPAPSPPAGLADVLSGLGGRMRVTVRRSMAHPAARWGHRGLVALLLCLCVWLFARKLEPHYPLRHWLFWSYARIWGWALLFAAACFSSGLLVLRSLLPDGVLLRLRGVYGMACGVLLFFLGVFVAGLLHLYGPTFAVAWPTVLLLAGAVPLVRRIRHVAPLLRVARRRMGPSPWWFWPVGGFGLLAVAAIYFTILTPGNLAFDTHFYHLGLAQQYAAERGIHRSAEGWASAAMPQLASVLYTWAMLVPRLPNVERVLLAGHLEFVLFLATLASLPPLVRWLCPGARTAVSWVTMFLFSGIFLYDASLTTAADHIAAFWAPAAYLAFVQAWRTLEPRRCALLGAVLAGALLTKYQSLQVCLLPVLGIAARALWLGIRALRQRQADGYRYLWGPLCALAAGLLLTAPHWLKNWVWYGDPLYPFLRNVLRLRPFLPDAAAAFPDYMQCCIGGWAPTGTTAEKLKETLRALMMFSFEPHDWKRFHGVVPVFGSLFTFGVFVLPLLRKTRRLWGLVLGVHLALFEWYWTMHQDRYLQAVLPWMVAALAGTIILVWRLGLLPRLALSALIGLQLVWGGDVYFVPTHAMLGTAPVKAVSDLLAMGFKKKYEGRLVVAREFEDVAAVLPPQARVLLHEENRRLGLWHAVVSDFAPWQYGIRWGRLGSAGEMQDLLVRLGVTHVLWHSGRSRGYDTLAGDLRFFDYVTNHAAPARRVGGWMLSAIAPARPTATGDVVAYLGCGSFYGRGLHHLDALNANELAPSKGARSVRAYAPAPTDPAELAAFLTQADFVVVGTGCKPAVPTDALGDLVQVASRHKEQMWLRRRAGARAPETAPVPQNEGDEDYGVPSAP